MPSVFWKEICRRLVKKYSGKIVHVGSNIRCDIKVDKNRTLQNMFSSVLKVPICQTDFVLKEGPGSTE